MKTVIRRDIGAVTQLRRRERGLDTTEDRFYLEHEAATLGDLSDWVAAMIVKHGEVHHLPISSGGRKRGRYIRFIAGAR